MSLNLRHDSIFGCSDKCLDNKILLDPLKEKLYLPPLLMALFNHLGDFGRTFQKGTSSSIEAPFRA